MNAFDQLRLRNNQSAAMPHSSVVMNGCVYTISTMSRSSGKNSISHFPSCGEVDRAAVLRTPSRTPRFHRNTSCDGSLACSSGGFPEGGKVPTRLSLSIADLHELAEMVRQFECPLAELWEKRRAVS